MTTDDILLLRLSNQYLLSSKFTTPQEAVIRFGAVQAQDYNGSKWGLGQRVEKANDAMLEQAFNEGKIIRTHVMRPTWHFVNPSDIRWLLKLTAPRVSKLIGTYNKQLNLTEQVFKKSQEVFRKALSGKKALSRQELKIELDRVNIKTTVQRLAHIVMQAELDGILCSGPRNGKQFTYMLLEERVPKTKLYDNDEALSLLTTRYFKSHGPATLKDFVWWSGMTMADGKRGISMLGKKLTHEVISDKIYWFMTDLPYPHEQSNILHLLPNYDEYGIAYTERETFFHPSYTKLLDVRGNAIFQHAIVHNGQFIGTWKRTLKRDTVLITPTFFDKPTDEVLTLFQKAADDFGKFLNLSVIID